MMSGISFSQLLSITPISLWAVIVINNVNVLYWQMDETQHLPTTRYFKILNVLRQKGMNEEEFDE